MLLVLQQRLKSSATHQFTTSLENTSGLILPWPPSTTDKSSDLQGRRVANKRVLSQRTWSWGSRYFAQLQVRCDNTRLLATRRPCKSELLSVVEGGHGRIRPLVFSREVVNWWVADDLSLCCRTRSIMQVHWEKCFRGSSHMLLSTRWSGDWHFCLVLPTYLPPLPGSSNLLKTYLKPTYLPQTYLNPT
jgi:hypothetical protein